MAVTNEVQTVTVTATGGTWSLNGAIGGFFNTGSMAYNITATDLQTKINAPLGAGSVTVSGGPGTTAPFVITFGGSYAGTDVALMSGNATSLTGTGAGVTVAETRKGGQTIASPPAVHGTPWQRNWTNSTTGPYTLPTGISTGDVLVAVAGVDVGLTIPTPTGWTLLWSKTTSGQTAAVAYAARYDSSGVSGVSTAPTLTWGGSSHYNFLWIAAYSGVSTSQLVDATDATAQNTASTAPTSPTVTTDIDNCALVWVAFSDSGSGSVTPPTGFTVRGTSTGGFAAADNTQTSAGATGTKAGSIGSSYKWIAGIIALPPATVAPSGSSSGFWGVKGSIVAGGGGGGVPSGTTVWKGDGTAALNTQWADISNNDNSGGNETSGSYTFPTSRCSFDTSFYPSGLSTSIKFQVFDGDNSYGERSELGQGNPFRDDWDVDDGNNKAGAGNPHMWYKGDDYWIASQIFVPTGFPTPSWQAIHQFKHIDDGDGGPLILGLTDTGSGPNWEWSVSNSPDYTVSNLTTIEDFDATDSFNRWNQFLVHIVFSDDNTVGLYDVYADFDGTGLVNIVPETHNYTMCKDFSTGILKPSHARIGIYRNPTVSTTSTLWIAGYNVATTKELAAYNAGITLP